ncbi:hypothetical protein EVAR_45878_1 [Eumeta japonica]|uniref:Uncharacterized protein n=1 Tax=Eumeta variegata TaxID=151549 RepID=A0A4C1XR25_EUMVA|nr:hypothetical protein EVAR_45878_1 [Eumeta japonica]
MLRSSFAGSQPRVEQPRHNDAKNRSPLSNNQRCSRISEPGFPVTKGGLRLRQFDSAPSGRPSSYDGRRDRD